LILLDKRIAGALALALLAASHGSSQVVNQRNGIRRVLLISIDGMHAVDYENCVNGGTCPNLAALGKTGVNYTRTSTSRPSDSFPGLMALVSGGTPKLVGAYYDVAYDRVLAPPSKSTGNGVFAGTCTVGTPNGTTTEYEEGVDLDQTKVNGGAPGAGLTDGGVNAIDPTRLPRDPFNGCTPVYPWNFVRANTIYGVIKKAGGYTAWSDKHPVYAVVSGPTGTSRPSNVDDYYSPEVNSNIIGLPGVTTPATALRPSGITCSDATGNPPDNNGGAWTDSFQNIQCYDTLKVHAILNQIDSKTHNGAPSRVPNIFGMNFQAVSVGQKLIEKINGTKVFGGYTDAAATPSHALLDAIEFVDASIGEMTAELKKQGLLDSTLVIVTAKHGQSPIDPNRFKELNKGITTTPADVVAGFLPPPPSPENPNTPTMNGLDPIGPTQDDISLLWLAHTSDTANAVSLLETNADAAGIGQIFYGPTLETMFGVPGVPPNGDPRTPDIIVQPYTGVVYTGSSKKQEEHGGFAQDDTNVMLLVSNPNFAAGTVTSFVETTQVAPTILQALGLDPTKLDAVQKEGTPVLPGLTFK
jgi:type I phosphodiesterase/nucleotide pyrophosphatase